MKLTREILSKGPKEYFLDLRKRTGMSRKEVSLKTGCSTYFIRQLETNEEIHFVNGAYNLDNVLSLYQKALNLDDSEMLSAEDAKYLVREWRRIRYAYTSGTSWSRQRLVNILGNTSKTYIFEDEDFLKEILDMVESKIVAVR